MSSYSKSTDFAAKDSLPSGNANKVVSGTEINTEFNAIETAVNSKANTASPTFTGIVSAGTVNIDGGNIDGTVIGSASAAAGTFTTITGTAITGTSLVIGAADVTEAELEILDGATVTTAELNVLDGITATTAELNYTDGVTSAIQTQLNTKAPLASPTFTGTATLPTVDINAGNIDGTVIGAAAAAAGSFTTVTASGAITGASLVIGAADVSEAELEILDGATVTTAELNVLDGITATTAELNYTDGVTSAIQTQMDLKAPLADPNFTGTAEVGTMDIASGSITDSSGAIDFGNENLSTTGTATMGALTVNGDAKVLGAAGNTLIIADASETNGYQLKANTSASTDFGFLIENLAGKDLFKVENNNDISFYEDTGTTPKFFWDASAEFLGIGTSSPSAALQVVAESGSIPALGAASSHAAIGSGGFGTMIGTRSTGVGYIQQQRFDGTATAYSLLLQPNGGNVGIGTSSPSETLFVENVSNNAILLNSPANRYNAVGFQSAGVDKWWMGRADTDIISGNAFFIGGDSGNASDAGGFSARLVIDSSGNVGIGISSPANPLDVNGVTSLRDALLFTSNTTGTPAAGGFVYRPASNTLAFGTNSAERMRIDSSGNVGIGTSSPTDKLNISSGTNQIGLDTGDQATFGTLDVGHFSNGAFIGTIAGSNAASNLLRFGTSGSERMRIDSSGNLLVGTTTTDRTASPGITLAPAGFIDVSRSGTIAGRFTRKVNDGSLIDFRKESTTVGSIGALSGTAYVLGSSKGLRLGSAGLIPATTAGANSDANYDIGDPAVRFKDLYLSGGVVVSTSLEDGTAQFKTLNANLATPAEQFYVGNNLGDVDLGNKRGALKFFTNTTEKMRIDSSGNVLVGTTDNSPVGNNVAGGIGLLPNGSGQFSRDDGTALLLNRKTSDGELLRFNKDGTAVGTISVTASATAYNTSSDYRLKEDDVPMTGATERVKALRPINFAWKATGERVDGFFAHEAQEVVPECATGTKDAMMDEEYEVTSAVYEDVIIPAVEAVEGVEAVEAVEAVDAVYDAEGKLVSEAIEAVEAVEGVEAVEAQEETTESVLVTEAVMGTRSVPDMQGIDQSKLVPLLTAAIQELIERIEALEAGA